MKKLILLILILLPLISADSINFIHPDNWARGSEITLDIEAFNDSDEIYLPTNITFNQELDGIYLNEIKHLTNKTRLIFLISQQAELGKQTLKLTIDGIEKEITINITEGISIQQKENKIFGLNKDTFYIILIAGVVIFLLSIIMLALIIDSKNQ